MVSHPLSAAELLDAASVCRGRTPAEQGVYLAALGLPGYSFSGCATLPIGERDAAITTLRQAMFGDRLELSATCPHCEARLDVAMNAAALLAIEAPVAPELAEIVIGGTRFAVRPADSGDLAAIGGIPDPDEARAELAQRCLVPLEGAGPLSRLDARDVDVVGAAMAEVDPAGDPFVALHCAGCGLDWEAPLDIAGIFADEIESAADALLDEIDALARAYHWSETAILALSQERRSAYLARLQS